MIQLVNIVSKKVIAIKGTSVIKADDDLIVTSADMKVGTYTIAAQPYLASKITFTHTATSTVDTLGTITLVGELDGVAQSETITPVSGKAVVSTKYYDKITSITGAGWVVADGADKIKVGVGADALIPVNGHSIEFYNVSGNLWINPLATAVADTTSFPMIAAGSIDLLVRGNLSVITDGSGGTLKYIIYDN